MSTPGNYRHRTSEYGNWRWNDELFKSKIGEEQGPVGCKPWLGSMGRKVGLFGATKNGHPQMVQARRILLMSLGYPEVEESAIRMHCRNDACMNESHMYLEDNRRLGIKMKNHVPRDFVETRMSLEKYENLSEETIHTIKALVKEMKADVRFDYEFQFYVVTWRRPDWLWAKLKAPNETDHLTVTPRRADNGKT
jgi:hypothetical protein